MLTPEQIDQAHLIDDLEKKRTRLVREVQSAINLLDTGMHAVRNGHLVAAEDHMDRAFEHLVKGLNAQK